MRPHIAMGSISDSPSIMSAEMYDAGASPVMSATMGGYPMSMSASMTAGEGGAGGAIHSSMGGMPLIGGR